MRALIILSDTGGGHRALSMAIAAGIERCEPGSAALLIDPFLSESAALPGRLMALYGPMIRRAPWLYGAIFDVLDAPENYARIARFLGRQVVERLVRTFVDERPDVVVIAHPLTMALILDAIEIVRQRHGRRIPTVAMVTELATVHWSWIDQRADRHLAATEEVERALGDRGIAPDRIVRTGLPVGPGFGRVDESPTETRRRLRLAADRTTALVLAGGEGSGPVGRLVPRLAVAMPELQIVVVCGRNVRLKRELASYGLPPTCLVLGFVDYMADLMHAADFVLTKGGPQTLSEALASGRPAIVTDLLPGQEQGNGAYIVRHGVGYLALTEPDMLAATRRLTDDAAERCRMSEAARAVAPGDAAANVARALRALIAAASPRG